MTDTAPPTILVVDDEPVLRLHVADMLEAAGYQVIDADDASAALKILEDRPDVRILFTDVQMPGDVDGLELARLVHARWPKVVLLVTSGGLNLSDAEIPDTGRFIPKPYLDDRVLTEVESLLKDPTT